MERLDRIYNYYQKFKMALLFISGVGIFGMTFYITIDVLWRNFAPTALVGTYEIVQYYFMPTIILLSMGYAFSSGVMPRIVAFVNRLPKGGQRVMGIILPIVDLIFCAVMGFLSTEYAVQATADQLTFICGTGLLPVWQMYYLVSLAYLMIAIEDIFVLIRNIKTGSSDVLYRKQ